MSEFEPERVEAVARALLSARKPLKITDKEWRLFWQWRDNPVCTASSLQRDVLAALAADEAYRREQRERHMAEAEFRERPERNRIIEGMEAAVEHAKGGETKARVTTITGPGRPRGLPGTFNGA